MYFVKKGYARLLEICGVLYSYLVLLPLTNS